MKLGLWWGASVFSRCSFERDYKRGWLCTFKNHFSPLLRKVITFPGEGTNFFPYRDFIQALRAVTYPSIEAGTAKQRLRFKFRSLLCQQGPPSGPGRACNFFSAVLRYLMAHRRSLENTSSCCPFHFGAKWLRFQLEGIASLCDVKSNSDTVNFNGWKECLNEDKRCSWRPINRKLINRNIKKEVKFF